MIGPWRNGMNLACGHRIDLPQTDTFPTYSYPPLRKDGWPRARQCPVCGIRRRVVSIPHELVVDASHRPE